VVQRLPVRIALDNSKAAEGLRAGMSVTVDVDTEHRNPLLSYLGSFIGKAKAAP